MTKKIDNPLSAIVGEVLTVDQVDDDGKPLKWKTAGIGSASIDETLTKSGYAADAKIVGDSLSQLDSKVDDKIGETELTVAVENALTVAKESGQFDGKDGQNGTDGKDGASVSVQSVVESTEDGGANVVTFSDGKQVTVHNGSKGSTGATGADGQPGATGTESLWEEICEQHDGSKYDPIPYNGNMALENGKYYSQNSVVYKCFRDTGNPVYHDLVDLVGLYVEVVE